MLYLVWRYGYDTRAFWLWWPFASSLLIRCYLISPPPPPPANNPGLPVNINYVYGLSYAAPQTWLPPLVYFLLLLTAMPVLVFWPTHWILKHVMRPADEPRAEGAGCPKT